MRAAIRLTSGRGGLAVGLLLVSLLASPATGRAALSPPINIDSANSLRSLACPSVSQCTAVDSKGQAVTFNPTIPGAPTPTAVDTPNFLLSIACPSLSQCTAVDDRGQQVTFNPTSLGTPSPVTLDAAAAPACPALRARL